MLPILDDANAFTQMTIGSNSSMLALSLSLYNFFPLPMLMFNTIVQPP